MIYADYAYYTDEYIGNAISEGDFPRMAAHASRYINYITQGKAEAFPEYSAIKDCCCALAEQYQLIDAAEIASAESLSDDYVELNSETVGSWSRSYANTASMAETVSKNAKAELTNIAYQYLSNTGLLYRGGRCRR